MKSCPKCHTRYTDDTLKFCLQDGTPLVFQTEDTSAPTVVLGETETVVAPRASNKIPFNVENQPSVDYSTNQNYVQPEEKSNTFKIVGLTVLTMFILLGAIGVGALVYFNKQKEVAKDTNTSKNTKTTAKQTPESNKTENAVNDSSTPTPTATPEKTPEINAGQIKKEVSQTIDSWKNAAENLDEDEHMSFYADKIDYYNKKDVNIDFVRKDKIRALSPYDDVEIDISNLSVTTDEKGEIATAVFDKKWTFEGDEKYSEGKVQSQVKFKKSGEKWKIISEKDLKVYYVNK